MRFFGKFTLSLIIFFNYAHSLYGQIVFTGADLPQTGDTLLFAIDTMPPDLDYGIPGSGQVWDFSALQARILTTNTYVDPALTPFSDSFPDANLALKVDFGQEAFTFLQQTDTSVEILGLVINQEALGGTRAVRFNSGQTFFNLPTQMGDMVTDTTSFSFEFEEPLTGSLLTFRSRIISRLITDAEGTVLLPGGSYESLRQRVYTEQRDSLFVTVFGFENLFDAAESVDSFYQWIAPKAKGILLNVDEGNSVTFYTPELANIRAPESLFTYELADSGRVQFQDASLHAPSAWAWDFDDRSFSTEQNPTHQFVQSGLYNVCLIASNLAGRDTSCQSLNIVVTDLLKLKSGLEFKLYPNPAADRLLLELKGNTAPINVRIFRPDGRQQFEGEFHQKTELIVGSWPAGIYSYQLAGYGKNLGSGQFVIVH